MFSFCHAVDCDNLEEAKQQYLSHCLYSLTIDLVTFLDQVDMNQLKGFDFGFEKMKLAPDVFKYSTAFS